MDAFLVGQGRVEQALARAMRARRLAHGLLFSGPSGVGRERAALGLASGLLCERQGPDFAHAPWGCGECRTCRRARAANHPDVHLLMSDAEAVRRGRQEPEGKKRPSSDILVDAVRELAVRLRMASWEGGARVAVVLDAHRMNTSAQNALLKTLEEPAAETFLVLIVPHERTVLPTIASRCLRLAFAPLSAEQIAAVLAGRGLTDAPLRARLASGSVGRALELDAASLEPNAPRAGERLARVLLEGTAAERLDAAEALGKERSDVDGALADLERVLAGALRHDAGAATEAGAELPPVGWRRAGALLEAVHEARRAIAQNANVQLCLEDLLLTRSLPPSPAAPR
jgi:DNA polymerase III subunit delta'